MNLSSARLVALGGAPVMFGGYHSSSLLRMHDLQALDRGLVERRQRQSPERTADPNVEQRFARRVAESTARSLAHRPCGSFRTSASCVTTPDNTAGSFLRAGTLTQNGDGVGISSIWSREETRTFGKAVTGSPRRKTLQAKSLPHRQSARVGAMKEGFVLEVLRPAGAAICRLQFRRRHFVFLRILPSGCWPGSSLCTCSNAASNRRRRRPAAGRALDQQRMLDDDGTANASAAAAKSDSQRSIERIERHLGTPPERIDRPNEPSPARGRLAVAARRQSAALETWRGWSARGGFGESRAQADRLGQPCLNLRRLASIARARTLAAIPSLNPDGGAINAGFRLAHRPLARVPQRARSGRRLRHAGAGGGVGYGRVRRLGRRFRHQNRSRSRQWLPYLVLPFSRSAWPSGQHVVKGEQIASVGSTGESTGPHLHYQVMHDGVAIDPMPYPQRRPAEDRWRHFRRVPAYSRAWIPYVTSTAIVGYVLNVYLLLMLVYALVSWVPSIRGRWSDVVARLVEPVLVPVRRIIPPSGRIRPFVSGRHPDHPVRERLDRHDSTPARFLNKDRRNHS